ncbi:MAG TPA: HD domain-containing phosphohydrolase [Vicinamibacterales bacterium]|nr:HD domain-containing phosphohydrolase [Vicinamibacterales bacterium]
MPAVRILVRATGAVTDLPDGVCLTAGRAAPCEVRVDDPSVSRRHCTLEARDGELHVEDLESANGTYVNDRLVRSGVARPGDVIRLGNAMLDVRSAEGSVAAGAAAVQRHEGAYESVIEKVFEPSRFEWLSTAAGGPELQLLERAQRHLATLHRVSELLAGARDMKGLADATLRAILEVTSADRAAVVLRRQDPSTGEAEVAAALSRDGVSERFSVSRTLVADVIEKGVSTFAHDASADDRFSEGESVIRQNVRSVMCVPLRTTDEVLGALYADSLSGPGRFTEGDLELLSAIGNQAGVALHRVRLLGELERLLLDTIRAIAATIDAKDGYTHRHSERVAMLARRLGQEMGLSDAELETVELSGLLHDVGKIAVPDAILNKPGRLTAEEFEEMKKHPGHGARILSNIQAPSVLAVLPGVKHHHEKWDGTGYPEGLAGEGIPLLGRLLGVADVFDALTSARSYRAAMPIDTAVRIIRDDAGTHFDPALSELVVRLHARGDLLPEEWDG